MEALNDLPTTKGILDQATKWTLEAQVGCYTQQRAQGKVVKYRSKSIFLLLLAPGYGKALQTGRGWHA